MQYWCGEHCDENIDGVLRGRGICLRMHEWRRRLIGERKLVLTQWKGPESLRLVISAVILLVRGRVGIVEAEVMGRAKKRAMDLESIFESLTLLFQGFGLQCCLFRFARCA